MSYIYFSDQAIHACFNFTAYMYQKNVQCLHESDFGVNMPLPYLSRLTIFIIFSLIFVSLWVVLQRKLN
uniref:Putative ovule protein n=1 Tax=Solanum chacoense TaxID=4108 RepID=A0A0V0GY87_SOLCH